MIIGIVSIVLPVLALILQCVFAGFSILCIPSIATAVFATLAFWKKGPVLALITVFMAFIQICTLNIQLTAILGLISAVASVFLMIDCEKFREAHPELEDPKAATKQMIIGFMLPCIITLLVMYAYPVVRTFLMSFFDMPNITASVSTWDFVGLGKYQKIFTSATFLRSLQNMLTIWILGGVITLALALLFAIILTSGIRFKKFFRAAIYMPNVISAVALATMWIQYIFNQQFISAVALATMWIQYIFNQQYGMLNSIIAFFNGTPINWLATDMKFWAMLGSFIFGAVGYYMLIFISGIEKIPADLYEAATIDGASKIQQAFKITFPLLKGVTKTNLTFWTINTATFYLWSKMFSPVDTEASVIVPVMYLYDTAFPSRGSSAADPGAAAAVGIVLAVIILAVYLVMNKVIKDDDIEL